MLAAGVTPDYPRPDKPGKFTLAGWLYVMLLGVLTVLTVASFRATNTEPNSDTFKRSGWLNRNHSYPFRSFPLRPLNLP